MDTFSDNLNHLQTTRQAYSGKHPA